VQKIKCEYDNKEGGGGEKEHKYEKLNNYDREKVKTTKKATTMVQ
jgi:hypothetical protein